MSEAILHLNSDFSKSVRKEDCVAVIGNAKIYVQHIGNEAEKKEA